MFIKNDRSLYVRLASLRAKAVPQKQTFTLPQKRDVYINHTSEEAFHSVLRN
jgi:hypothetical protein